ncbi:MAG: Gfo/Idh/MocA family oxidoreductase [Polyangiaceae bacterium]
MKAPTNRTQKGDPKSDRKIRYAVIGLGNISQVAVLPAFAHAKENSELVALISSDEEKLRVLGKRYDVELTGSYDDVPSLLARGIIDAAYIALPNSQHRKMTEIVSAHGVHVLCEKPMAMTVGDCEAMIRVTEEHGVRLMIAYRLHFEKANMTAVDRILQSMIGEPLFFSSVFGHLVRPGDIRTRDDLGGGALFDMGVYCVNAARYLFGAEPEEVFATQIMSADERFPDVDATTTAVLRFPGQRVAQFTASQASADVAELRVVGSKGDVRLDPAYEYAGPRKEYLTVEGDTKQTTYPKSDQFAPELVHFSRCILEDVEPEPSGEEGLADVRVLEAILHSARSGKVVKLPPFTRRQRPSLDQAMQKPPIPKIRTVNAPSPSK